MTVEKDKQEKTNEEATSETQENQEDTDLKKSLNENLEKMSELTKSSKNVDIEELMKDASTKKKIKAYMKKENNNEEEEEVEEENEKKTKVKKSLDETIEENDEIIDGIPVMKAFTEVLSKVVDVVDILKSKLDEIDENVNNNNEIVKSMGEVIKSESELIKSTSEAIDKIGNKPEKKKGVIKESDILSKSFNNEDGSGEKKLSPQLIKSAVMEGFEKGKVSSNSLSKWELKNYDISVFNDTELNFIKSYIEGGK